MASLGVHDGTFHADEVTACALLILFGKIDEKKIVRTRDLAVLAKCDYVCDVGGIYDPAKKRFDHHQSDYTGLLSSAGMVLEFLHDEKVLDDPIHAFLKNHLVDGVDSIDIGAYTPPSGLSTFSNVVSEFMPIDHEASREEHDAAFFEALQFVKRHIEHMIKRSDYIQQARGLVEKEMAKGANVLYFERSIPWLDAFFELGGEAHPAQFLIMPSGEHWKLRGIPPSYEERMAVRKPLPEEWAGLLKDELVQKSGIKGAIFCHKGRFISIWETKEDVLKALEVTLGKNSL